MEQRRQARDRGERRDRLRARVKAVAAIKAMTAAEVKQAAWADAIGLCCTAVAAGVDTFIDTINLRLRPVTDFAEWRYIASLYDTSRASLGTFDFKELLEDADAIPYMPAGMTSPRRPWTWARAGCGGAPTAAEADDDDDDDDADDSHLDSGIKAQLSVNWVTLNAHVAATVHDDPPAC